MTGLTDLWLDLPDAAPAALENIGVTGRAAAIVGGVREAKIRRRRQRFFDWDEDGERVLLVGAWVEPPSIFRSVDDPVLLDIVAVDPACPRRCAVLTSNAVMLGEWTLLDAQFRDVSLAVFRDPIAWLRAGGAGVVPLHARQFVDTVLMSPMLRLVAEDVEHRKRIQLAIKDAAVVHLPTVDLKRADV